MGSRRLLALTIGVSACAVAAQSATDAPIAVVDAELAGTAVEPRELALPPAPELLGTPVALTPAPVAVLTGRASWYSDRLAGRRTASGERYDPALYTAAHRELPFGTLLRVTNLANGSSVEVRVNDRGPFTRGRVLDLSRRAAEELGFIHAGHTEVRIEVLATGG